MDREKGQSNTSMLSAGSSILGMLVGSFLGGRRTRMSTVARGVGYASQQGADVRRAESALKSLEDGKKKLDDELQQDLDDLHDDYDLEKIDLQEIEIPPRKSDLKVDNPMIVWIPWQVDPQGAQTRLH